MYPALLAHIKLVQRRRRWTSIKLTLVQRLVHTGQAGMIDKSVVTATCTWLPTDAGMAGFYFYLTLG